MESNCVNSDAELLSDSGVAVPSPEQSHNLPLPEGEVRGHDGTARAQHKVVATATDSNLGERMLGPFPLVRSTR